MAILEPSLEVIKRSKVQPTEGEWKLLNFLIGNLDDTYEIYFQPFLNGDNPDIAIMRQGSGVLIIEVKDWNLNHYYVDEKTRWRLQKNNTLIRSPLQQVENYKENLFNLHIEELFLKKIQNKNHWATVHCAVYFHKSTEKQVKDFLLDGFANDTTEHDYSYYRKFIGYFGLLGYDSLTSSNLNALLTRFWLNKPSRYFDDILYKSFHRYLKAPVHKLEEGIEIIYTKEQQELIKSGAGLKRKIKGAAGSGKTLVLAKRAVNAHIRTGSRILILTYNLSLKNYIHDRISDVREEFYWNHFYITNYHQFFKSQAVHYNLEIHGLDAWQNINFFEDVKDNINRFDVVLIDEVQDYMQDWMDIIAKYFTHSETELVVFGDEKQNIYDRKLDENNEPVVRTVPGRWNKSLNTSHRFASNIGNLALKFQKNVFGQKYTPDELNVLSKLDFEARIVEYHSFNGLVPQQIFNNIYDVLLRNQIHSSDVGILCSKVELLRELDYLIRTKKHEKTKTTFETQEEFDQIKEDEIQKLRTKGHSENEIKGLINKMMHDRLEDVRKLRKNHFVMKTGTVKLSTIHSFKGWEIDTLFLFLQREDEGKEFTNAELTYTGITRARRNLIVFNFGNTQYDHFFKNEIDRKHIHA